MRGFGVIIFVGINAALASINPCVYEATKCQPLRTVLLEDGSSVELVKKWTLGPKLGTSSCQSGFYTCRKPDCTSTSCPSEFTCLETRTSYKCICPTGYYGSKCEHAISTSSQLSTNGTMTTMTSMFTSSNASISMLATEQLFSYTETDIYAPTSAPTSASTTQDVTSSPQTTTTINTMSASTPDSTTLYVSSPTTTIYTTSVSTPDSTTQYVTSPTTTIYTTSASTPDSTTQYVTSPTTTIYTTSVSTPDSTTQYVTSPTTTIYTASASTPDSTTQYVTSNSPTTIYTTSASTPVSMTQDVTSNSQTTTSTTTTTIINTTPITTTTTTVPTTATSTTFPTTDHTTTAITTTATIPTTLRTTAQASTTVAESLSASSSPGKRYRHNSPPVLQNFEDARQACIALDPTSSNSGLIELTDDVEKEEIIDYVSSTTIPAGSSLWIGCPKYLSGDPLHGFYCYNSVYRFSSRDNINIGYWDWDTGEPQKSGRRCMVLNLATEKYRAEYCGDAVAYAVCEGISS